MKEQDCAVLAMEVVLTDMERLAGLYFDVAAFGIFSRDHWLLVMEKASKVKLFTNHLYTLTQSTQKPLFLFLIMMMPSIPYWEYSKKYGTSHILWKSLSVYKSTPRNYGILRGTTKEWFVCLFEI